MSAKKALLAAVRGFALGTFSLIGSSLLLVLTLLAAALVPLGVGTLLMPPLLGLVRRFADLRRLAAARWYGITIPLAEYDPGPAGLPAVGPARTLRLMADPAVHRDLRWLPVDMTAGFLLAMLPVALLSNAVQGIALPLGHWRVVADGADYWYLFLPVGGQADAIGAGLLGLVVLYLAFRYNDRLLAAHFTLTRAVLAPDRATLERRVAELARTRHDAVGASAAELRRIERDLHDGAQARLVAMGMSLGTIETLLDKDPAQARKLLAQARAESAEALAELRDLVRGIPPPVLAERGLGDAARALALRTPLPVEAHVDLPGRPEAAVESAVYFALSEMLTNVVKHARATRIWLELGHRDGMLRLTVTDDGHGGADPAAGTGLAGVERRLGAFDGVLAVSSPTGGPTVVTLEIPCALSSPKTSSC
ncbi:sensor histidine kinase [Streptomyces fragilis]|uniref:sensor histidine kinase n=1 Tax=Streptomyces fragilis TaxID=67301 RepID=UPI0024DECACD|nr:histidine kinase [Streptomyces fragilis]